jgi:quercetin dioxygenase-like cupin family protein
VRPANAAGLVIFFIVCCGETIVKQISRWHWVAGVALFGAGLCSGLMAQSGRPDPNAAFRTEQKRLDLDGAPGMEVIASLIEIKPGENSKVHFHHGIEVAYVLQGAMTQAPGKEPTLNATGGTLLNLRDIRHGEFKVVGDKSLRLFAVHIVDKGKPLYDYAQ